jgi:hypothetical protein
MYFYPQTINPPMYDCLKAWHPFLSKKVGGYEKSMGFMRYHIPVSEETLRRLYEYIWKLKHKYKENYNFDLLWSKIQTIPKLERDEFLASLSVILNKKEVCIQNLSKYNNVHSAKELIFCCKYTKNIKLDLCMLEDLFKKFIDATKGRIFKTITLIFNTDTDIVKSNINIKKRTEAIARMASKTTMVVMFLYATLYPLVAQKIPGTFIDEFLQPMLKKTKNLVLQTWCPEHVLEMMEPIKHESCNFLKKIKFFALPFCALEDAKQSKLEQTLKLFPNLKKIIIDNGANAQYGIACWTMIFPYIVQMAIKKGIDIELKNVPIPSLMVNEVTIEGVINRIKKSLNSILPDNDDAKVCNSRFDVTGMTCQSLVLPTQMTKKALQQFRDELKKWFNDFNARCDYNKFKSFQKK